MTHKDFKHMTDLIAAMNDRLTALIIAENFARVAKTQNPRFNTQKFYDACGLGVK
jgi:hypothetical protein